MILDVADIVKRVVPSLFAGRPVSVTCVRTTQPKYLVFDSDDFRPMCVVQFGPKVVLERLDGVLTRLFSRLPDSVAKPLGVFQWRNGTHVQIQSGLPGLPWFRLADRCRTRASWDRLGARASECLKRLHAATWRFADWSENFSPAAELRRQLDLSTARRVALSARVHSLVAASARDLEDVGTFQACWQHGDFCLNNLLVGPDHMAVIDFDDFGHTSMPLHDEFSLALSLNALAKQAGAAIPLEDDVRRCIAHADWAEPIGPRTVRALFVHHLLWRINQCHGLQTRARAREELLAQLEHFAASPDMLDTQVPTAA